MQSPFIKQYQSTSYCEVHIQPYFVCNTSFRPVHLGLNLLIPTVAAAVNKTPYLKFTLLIFPEL